MTLGERIRHGTKWLFMGGVSGQALQFVFGVVLARLLVPEDFGLLVTVQIFTGFVGMIASGGMGEATVQAREVSERDYQTMFAVQLAMGLVIYAGFFLIAPWFARWFGQPIYEPLLRVSALSFLIRPFSANPGVRLRRAMRFKETAVIGLVSMSFAGALSILWAWMGWGVWSLVLSGLAGAVLSALLLSWRAPWRPIPRYDGESARRLGAYGAKNVLNELLVYFRAQTPNFLITKTLGPAAVGLYNKADSLSDMPLRLLGGSTYQTVFRAMSQVQDDMALSQYLFLRTATLLSFYLAPIQVAIALTSQDFIVALYGVNWLESALPLSILMLGGIFAGFGYAAGAAVAAHAHLGKESVYQLQVWAMLAFGTYFAVPYGINAVAIVTAISSLFMAFLLTQLALRILRLSWRSTWAALRGLTVPLLAECVVLLLVKEGIDEAGVVNSLLRLALVGGAGLACYAATVLLAPPRGLEQEINRWRALIGLKTLSLKETRE
ncbi:MAG: lipopolysaccharide biosynthesis protein [Burkholderiales bacterium]